MENRCTVSLYNNGHVKKNIEISKKMDYIKMDGYINNIVSFYFKRKFLSRINIISNAKK